jgi:hypothetical protein
LKWNTSASAYADYGNLVADIIDTIKQNAKTFIEARRDVGLEVNAEKRSICCYSHLTAGPNHDINIANTSFENLALFSI